MNIQQLEYLVAVSEEKNFLDAADKCFITQSTLSTMLIKLEEELGVNLLNRKQKPVRFTDEGEIILEKAKAILKEVDDLKFLAKELKGEFGGEISLSVIPTIAPYVVPELVHKMKEKHHDIRLKINERVTDEIVQLLVTRKIDIGWVSLPVKHPDLVEIPLYFEDFLMFDCSENKHEIKNIEAVDKENLWLLTEGHCLRAQILDLCHSDQVRHNIDYQTGSIDTLVRMVEQNKGITFLPKLSTLEFSKERYDKLKKIKNAEPNREIGLLVHKNFAKKQMLFRLKMEILQIVENLNKKAVFI